MAVDIGLEAIDRPSSAGAGWTYVNESIAANASGIITSIEIWAFEDITNLKVGTLYTTNGNTLKCRDSEAIPGTITAGSKVIKEVSIAVEIGDYIGFYSPAGRVEFHITSYLGIWYIHSDGLVPDAEEVYTYLAGYGFSVGGYIEEAVGWTGEIAGVTNPASIMGVDVANIAEVKGVASA